MHSSLWNEVCQLVSRIPTLYQTASLGKGPVKCTYHSRSAGMYDTTTKSITQSPKLERAQLLSACKCAWQHLPSLLCWFTIMATPPLDSTTIAEAAESLCFSLKPKQRICLQKFIGGNDVFVSLPTGYGDVYFYLEFFILWGEQRINQL